MNLDRVTITGADDSIEPEALVPLARAFPFVEWGVLVSKQQEGGPRFPHRRWIERLTDYAPPNLALSLHVCGRWVRDLMVGRDTLFQDLGTPLELRRFQRVQLNFHASFHESQVEEVAALFRRELPEQQIIVQMDEVNDPVLFSLRRVGLDAVPLFDTSGGAGMVPGEWPLPFQAVPYHGYAGGLGPETLERELRRIREVTARQRIWIDMERRVRSEDDRQFDLEKVRRCLEICAPWVTAR